MKLTAIQCPSCKDIIYSRARHDMRYCTCRAVFIDGGPSGGSFRVGGPITADSWATLDLDVTEQQLYDDWNHAADTFGLIKGGQDDEAKTDEPVRLFPFGTGVIGRDGVGKEWKGLYLAPSHFEDGCEYHNVCIEQMGKVLFAITHLHSVTLDPQSARAKLMALDAEFNTFRAAVVKAGVCLYGGKEPGAPMNTCRKGFPGCDCADVLVMDPDFEGPAPPHKTRSALDN